MDKCYFCKQPRKATDVGVSVAQNGIVNTGIQQMPELYFVDFYCNILKKESGLCQTTEGHCLLNEISGHFWEFCQSFLLNNNKPFNGSGKTFKDQVSVEVFTSKKNWSDQMFNVQHLPVGVWRNNGQNDEGTMDTMLVQELAVND